MRIAAWLIAGLLTGMVLGSWSLKTDLRKAQSEIASLQKQVQEAGRKKGRMPGITSMLNLSSGSSASTRSEATNVTAERAQNTVARDDRRQGPWGHRRRHGTNGVPEQRNMKAEIETAANLWKTRSDIARESFISSADIKEQQAVKFDVLMASMNLRLSNSIRTWVDQVKTNELITPESGIRMMNDVSGVFVQTYTDLDREIPQWREATENTFNAMDFVDPFVALPMTEIEGELNEQQWEQRDSLDENQAGKLRSPGQQ